MKNKKITLCLLISCIIFATPVMACENPEEYYILSVSTKKKDIIPYADKIIKKYQVIDGKLYYRRWNETRKCWVDPKWILVQ